MREPVKRFQVLTWDVNFRATSVLDALGVLPDIVTLQDVTLSQAPSFHERLEAAGLHAVFTGEPAAADKRYGTIIASRSPLKRIPVASVDPPLPWPQLVGHVVVKDEAAPVHVITAHIPNCSTYGWAKIDTLRALARVVTRLRGHPLILTGDFNEPQFELQGGRIVTWGQEKGRDGRYRCWLRWTKKGRTGTGEEWDAAVRWFFESPDASGLRNAYWDTAGHGARECTHVSDGESRWFDHAFISDELQVQSCEYLHTVREQGWSDHSALVARLAYAPGSRPSTPTRSARRTSAQR